ncbi:hypothetical protein V6N12_028500 [Hibiscus sabdariffa]|uniref:DUF4283 domain-containing protein n=1 Tax=Hibiscus sabdariffa TaxID=183260 RepID=A0ABR2F603_9ROSI
MTAMVDDDPPPAVSYKEAMMNDLPLDLEDDDDLVSIDDDDIDLLDDDVRIGERDGIPFIDFSSRVHDLAVKSLEFTLVLSILGRRVGYSALYNRLMINENNHFLINFSSRSDYIVALTDGPWTIFGYYITVEPWSPDFDPSQPHPS